MDEADAENSAAVRGPLLFTQLGLLLDSDPLIDELGFIHPDQLTSLHAADASRNGSPDPVSETYQTSTAAVPGSKGDTHLHSSHSSLEDAKHGELKGQGSSDRTARPPAVTASTDETFAGHDLMGLRLDSPKAASETVARSSSLPRDIQSFSNFSGEIEIRVDCSGNAKSTASAEDSHGVPLSYDTSVFWCGDHKLAISMLALPPLYVYAQAAFMAIRKNYEKLVQNGGRHESSKSRESSFDTSGGGALPGGTDQLKLEDTLLSYSRVLLLVNCDLASAWNTRKRITLERGSTLKLFTEELQLATLVLSRGPKSEETWAHRRWVVNQIVATGIAQPELDAILERESKLVEAIAGKSAMNYRAWRHRCWLVPQMSSLQIAIELHRTKLWARSHIADNCCFHYRRILLLQLTKSKTSEGNGASGTEVATQNRDLKVLKAVRLDDSEIRTVWKEEMDWIKDLIQQYKGREALWIHLRFLLSCWIHHVGVRSGSSTNQSQSAWSACGILRANSKDLNILEIEIIFSEDCLSQCALDQTNDGLKQREHAASYKLWTLALVSRHTKNSEGSIAEHILDVRELLHEVAPHRSRLWDGLVANLNLQKINL